MQFLSSEEIQLKSSLSRAPDSPTRMAVYDAPELQEANPFMASLKDIFTGSTPRPIHPAYPQMSLAMPVWPLGCAGQPDGVQEALDSIAQQLTDIIGYSSFSGRARRASSRSSSAQ